ncbi:MAG TPA: glycosyltransferase family 39 protein [Coleofasciculaceae cyanobacterium]|jgi:4-amino-4-deoxy-L-arabinose transferase-like glycosyltransferase
MNRKEQSVATGRDLLPELILLVTMALLFAVNATAFDIDPYSELFHIVSAKESVAAGRFWTPMLNGHDYLMRAPFWTWLVIPFFKLLGTSLLVARIPAVICALAGVALTYALTMALTRNRMSALFASSILGTSWGYLQMGSLSTADILATDLYLAFGWCLIQWHSVAGRRQTLPIEMTVYSVSFGLIVGFMLLVKGTLGALMLTTLGLLYLGLNGRLEILERLDFRYLLGLAVLIPLPWLAWTSYTSGNTLFPVDYLLFHPLNRYLGMGAWQGLHANPWLYVRQMTVGLLPYVFFLPALLFDQDPGAFRRSFTDNQSATPWLFAWLLLGVGVASFSAFQEPSLMLPFYPPVAILIGSYLGRSAEAAVGTRFFNRTMSIYVVILMALAVMMASLIFQVLPSNYVNGFWHGPGQPVLEFLEIKDHKIELPEAFPIWKLWLIPAPFILLLGGVLVYILQVMRRVSTSTVALIATSAVFLLFLKAVYLPMIQRPVPQAIAEALNKQVTQQDEIMLYSLHPDVKRVLFYLDADKLDQVRFVRQPKQLEKRLAEGQGRVFGVIREKSFFNDLDYNYRNLLHVNYFDWKWDTSRLGELRKFMAIRLPVFDKMKSEMLYFQSMPRSAMAELQAQLLPDPADNDPDFAKSGGANR